MNRYYSLYHYTLNGQPISTIDLAARAGCTKHAMRKRLTTGGLTPEQAVAAGARKKPAPRRDRPLVPKHHQKPAAKGPHKVTRSAWAKDAEANISGDTKVTIAAAPPGRFDIVGPAPSVFGAMRPGQYLQHDSAIARAYGAEP